MYKPNYIVTDIFKYQLYQTILDVDTDKIKKYALSLKKKSKGRTRSNVLGWQSDDLKDYLNNQGPKINNSLKRQRSKQL